MVDRYQSRHRKAGNATAMFLCYRHHLLLYADKFPLIPGCLDSNQQLEPVLTSKLNSFIRKYQIVGVMKHCLDIDRNPGFGKMMNFLKNHNRDGKLDAIVRAIISIP
jgi:hypothetical protein